MSADEELFARIRAAISRGWINVPEEYGYGGTGGPGRILEELLDAEGGNLDTPDAGKWEIKYINAPKQTPIQLRMAGRNDSPLASRRAAFRAPRRQRTFSNGHHCLRRVPDARSDPFATG